MKFLFLVFALMFTSLVFAQDATPIAQSPGASVVLALNSANERIPAALPATVLAVIGFLVELSVRFLPTSKPRSLFLVVASIFGLIGTIFTKISGLLDSVVQNLKADPADSGSDKKSA